MPAAHAADVTVVSETHVLPGVIWIGFGSSAKTGAGTKIEANEIVPKALAGPVTAAEFQAVLPELKAAWSRRTVEATWLDMDTFRVASLDTYTDSFESVKLADVNAFADKARSRPIATVLVNTPPAAN